MLMLPRLLLAACVCTCANVQGTEPSDTSIDPSTPLLTDQSLTLTVADLQRELDALAPQQRANIQRSGAALREFVDGWYFDSRLERQADASGVSQQPTLQARLQRERRLLLAQALLDQYLREVERNAPDFTPLALDWYRTHRDDYRQPERIRVSQILFKVEVEDPHAPPEAAVRALALESLDALHRGEDYALVAARAASTSPFVDSRELPGWLVTGKTVPPFEQAAFALQKPGDISELVRTRFGLHIIRLLARQPAEVSPFAAVKDSIEQKLRQEFIAAQRQSFIQQFSPDTSLKVDQALLDRFVQHPVATQ